jgi:hypothetical protein
MMSSLSPALLQDIAEALARLPIAPEDLPLIQAQLEAQAEGLGRLDALDLSRVEPATVLLPPAEASR